MDDSGEHSPGANMSNKPFKIEGDFQMGRIRQHFVIETAAASEKAAQDRILATLGSRHGVNRRQVSIQSTKSLSNDAVTDAVVRAELGLK